MLTPPYLKTGDTIGIIAPSRSTDSVSLRHSIKLFEKEGLNVVFGNNLFNKHNQFAGSDEERAADIMDMYSNTSIKAILCARGGYGSVRTLQHMDLQKIKTNPKWFIGYSDITVFHSALHSLGTETIHATMPINITTEAETENFSLLINILKGKKLEYATDSNTLNIPGKAEGQLIGGNLSVLYSLRGTPADIDTNGKILFIEDIDEYLYHIDRMMMNIRYGGLLQNIKGLIVGGMTDVKDNNIPFGLSAEEIILKHAADLNIPVCFGFPSGHTPKNLPLILGRTVNLNVDGNVKLKFL